MHAISAILILFSVAVTSLVPVRSSAQEPEPPGRFEIPYLQADTVAAHRLVVYRGPRSGQASGLHQEFVLEQGGHLEFREREATQAVAAVVEVQAGQVDPLGMVQEHFGSLQRERELEVVRSNTRDVGCGTGLASEQVLRILLTQDAKVIFEMEAALAAPYSGEHAKAMAAAFSLWEALHAQVLEANARLECKTPEPQSLEEKAAQWEARWREQAMAEMRAKLQMDG